MMVCPLNEATPRNNVWRRFMSKNPEEAMDFLSYVAEVSRGWDEPTKGEVGKMKSQLECLQCKGWDLKGKCTEIKQMLLDNSGPITMRLMEIPTTQVGGIIQISHGRPEQLSTNSGSHHLNNLQVLNQQMANLSKVMGNFVGKQEATNAQINQRIDRVEIMLNKRMDGMQNDMNQKFDNIQYSISRLTNLNTLQENGRFPSQPHQNPKGVHEVESQEGESLQVKEVKALITLRSEGIYEGRKAEEINFSSFCSSITWEKRGLENAAKILEVLRQVKVNIPLLDMIKQVLTTKDPGSPTISVMIGGKVVEKALLDLGASVNLLPYSVYKQLGLGELKPTTITLSLADRSVKIPRGVIEDVLVQVDNFYYPVDFIVLDTDPTVKEANLVPIILGRPFLATSNAIINCRNGLMQLTFGNMTLDLNIFYMSKKQITPEEEEGPEELCIIDTLVEEHCNQNMQDKLNESLVDFEEGLSESPIGFATLQSWRKIEEILPLFNEGRGGSC
ncbi:hypothetical protein CK203_089416 [Vitis vinifera]|uniref:Peptidase A2 domain-containing protein n=1 Tax=Vitis vinifera TaxID=29760 RepID=A0A438E8Q4_VITVI|nr:hypothetical protein CK203_089416 [Vitis vinifera]